MMHQEWQAVIVHLRRGHMQCRGLDLLYRVWGASF